MQHARVALCLLVLILASLIAAGCGSSADDANGVPVIGFMTWRDQTDVSDKMYRDCEQKSGNKYKLAPVTMGPTVDAAREQLTRRLGAGDDTIDLINLDVVWTAEFADAGWLVDVTERVEPIKDTFVPSALDSAFYKNKYWGLPVNANASLLYYRSDLVPTPPKTWEDLVKNVKDVQQKQPDMAGFIFQGAPAEAGTVNALEFLYGAGAQVLSEDGSESIIEKDGNAEFAFTFLTNLIKDGISPKVITTYTEEETRLAFQNGGAVFMRNWPYAGELMATDKSSKVRGKFKMALLPGFEGRADANVLGGQNFGISATTDDPELAWEALTCLGSADMQYIKATAKGELPALSASFDEERLVKEIDYLPLSKEAIGRGSNRPESPYYGDVSSSIFRAYNDVLAGRVSPKDGVKRMDNAIQSAIDGKAEI